ncbi:MAG TPA: ATP-binding protein [Longimicrobiaceae bacterium]
MRPAADTETRRDRPSAPRGRERADGGLPGEAAAAAAGMEAPSKAQYQLMVERVHEYAVFLMDRHGVITHWGEGAERIKEFTPEEMVGRHLRMLYPEGGAEDGTAEEHLREAADAGEYIGEGTRRARDRGFFPARVVLTALRHGGELVGFSKVTQDLTERRRIEERLHEALRDAQEANQEKGRFLATISHEIRTPINAIVGYADLLELGSAGPLTELQHGYLERVRASSRHLLAIIEDVLDFARVEAGRLLVEPRRARLAEATEAALALVRPQAERQGIALEAECDAEAEYWGDENRVRQVLVNLLGNAAKFTAGGGRIRVACGRGEPGPEAQLHGPGPWSCVRVEDTGIGIPADRLAAVFEPFVQVDGALTRVHQGSGLGLAISRRLARLMGGDLTVSSREGEGSVFTLWLPAVEGAAEAADARRRPRRSGSLSRVGHALGDAAHQVVGAFARRLRVDPALPEAHERTRSELENHTATLLTDLAQVLVLLEEDGEDAPATARDGQEVQRLLARRHGAQRRRLGWSEAGLRREYAILREETESALRDTAGAESSREAVDESLAVVHRLLGAAEELSVEAFREGPDAG